MVSNYGQKSMDMAFNGLSTLEKHEVMLHSTMPVDTSYPIIARMCHFKLPNYCTLGNN